MIFWFCCFTKTFGAQDTQILEISFFLIIFSRRHSCPPEQRVRTLAEGEEEKLYESLNPMNEMQSDSDEMAPEDGKCSLKSTYRYCFNILILKQYRYVLFWIYEIM